MVLQLYPPSQQAQEVLERGAHLVVAKQFLLRRLAVLLIEHSKLEVRHQYVLVVVRYQLAAPRTQDRHEVLHVELVVQELRHLGGIGRTAQARRGHDLVHRARRQPQEDAGVLLVCYVFGFD